MTLSIITTQVVKSLQWTAVSHTKRFTLNIYLPSVNYMKCVMNSYWVGLVSHTPYTIRDVAL